MSVCVYTYTHIYIHRYIDVNTNAQQTEAPATHEIPFQDRLPRSSAVELNDPCPLPQRVGLALGGSVTVSLP